MYSDEWDPWKRYWREQERRMWDPLYRYKYERDRLTWDPFYRHMKEQERLQWDPWYRAVKEIERKYNDPEYRWRRYEESRYTSEWYERYMENPADLVLRDRYEMLYGRSDREVMEHNLTQSSTPQISSISAPLPATDELAQPVMQTPSGSSSYVPYLGSSEDLPSLAAVLAEGIIPPAIVGFFTLAMYFGWSSASPFFFALMFLCASAFSAAAEAKRTTVLLLVYSLLLLLLEPWAIFVDFQTAWRIYFNALVKATVVLSIIGALYILYWWRKIREEG